MTHDFLIRLCLLLIEIGLGETIDIYQPNAYAGKCDELSEAKLLALLVQWKQDRTNDLSHGFHKAIEFCLTSFITKDFLLKEDEHLASAIEKVVLPLTEEYETFAGIVCTS